MIRQFKLGGEGQRRELEQQVLPVGLMLTLWTSNYFLQTPVGARLIFSMLLLGAKLIFAKLPPGARLFFESEKRRGPSRAIMPVTK